MFNSRNTPPAPTTDRYMADIVARQACGKHGAPMGSPCWSVRDTFSAICNRRAKKAGFSHVISEKSLQLNRRKK